ncbi:MAG: DUF4905 domain-containing protein [Ignavibacteria bacterium]|nr:DUF4905 domain-containing protein [Ignavibacteria bacterium]
MQLLNALRTKGIRPAWRYAPGGILWRVFPSHPDVLVGEERDIDRKQAGFFCLARETGHVLWEKRSFDEQWWIGIESVGRDVVFLHCFAKPDMPGHKGIIALDLRSGEELWRNDDLTLDKVFATTILASRVTMTGSEQMALHARSGERSEGTEADNGEGASPIAEVEMNFPEEADPLRDEHPELSAMREHLPPRELLAGPLEFVNLQSLLVMGFHERLVPAQSTLPRFRHTVLVGDKVSGRILFRDTIASDSTGIVPDSFFVQDGMLFFVKERTALIAVNLKDRIRGA